MTIDELKTQRPDLYERIFIGGTKSEQERFTGLLDSCGDDVNLLIDSFVIGRSSEETLKLRITKAEAQKRELLLDENLLRQEFAESPEFQQQFGKGGVNAFMTSRRREASRTEIK